MGYQHLQIERDGPIATIWLNRPDKLNALSEDMWTDLPLAVDVLSNDDQVRVIVLAGREGTFTVGIDIGLLGSVRPEGSSPAAANMHLYGLIKRMQGTVNAFAETPKPVIAAVSGYCLGAGVNIISACDIRLASEDAVFSIRETKMGLVADIGALQRLPAIVGDGVTAEMAMTGSDYPGAWALEKGLVNQLFETPRETMDGAMAMALQIASNSPMAVQGVKKALQANDGLTIEQALERMAQWNSSFLISNDLMEALAAFSEKRDPDFTGT